MWTVEYKDRRTGRKGKYYSMCLDEARGHEARLKSDKGLKSVKLRKVG